MPVVGAARRQAGQRPCDPVRRNRMVWVDASDQLHAPAHPAVSVLDLELQPVEYIWLGPPGARRRHVLPVRKTVAEPGLRQRLQVAVFLPQPLSEGGSGGRAVAGVPAVVALIPDVVAAETRVPTVARRQLCQEAPRGPADLVVVEAETGEATGHTAPAHLGVQAPPVRQLDPGLVEPAPRPLRRGGDHLRNDRPDPV